MITTEMRESLDDGWRAVVLAHLDPYMETIKAWWATPDNVPEDVKTGYYPIEGDHPGNLYVRFTANAKRSPIKGVQAFPFIPASALNIQAVPGGYIHMIQRVFANKPICYGGYTIHELHNLPSLFNGGQVLAVVPEDVYGNCRDKGSWVYLSYDEIREILRGNVAGSLMDKAARRLPKNCQ